jgi:hypothetical protein
VTIKKAILAIGITVLAFEQLYLLYEVEALKVRVENNTASS